MNIFLRKLIYLVIVSLVIFGLVKFYLFFNFIIGNDLIVEIDTEKNYIELTQDSEYRLEFNSHISKNPFCSVSCKYRFYDLSSDFLIEEGNFTLRSSIPMTKDFEIVMPSKGEGILFYQYELSCSGKSTNLCHSNKNPTINSDLIIINYTLDFEKRELREELRKNIIDNYNTLKIYESTFENIKSIHEKLSKLIFIEDVSKFEETIKLYDQNINDSSIKWYSENFQSILLKKIDLEEISSKNIEFETKLESYNQVVNQTVDLRNRLEGKNDNLSEKSFEEISKIINKFNKEILKKDSLENKFKKLSEISTNLSSLNFTEGNLSGPKIINVSINEVKHTRFVMNLTKKLEIDIPEPACCLSGECMSCYSEKPPLIFVHGHAVSESTSAYYSLTGFTKIQKKLEQNGILNGGIAKDIFISEESEKFYNIGYPVSFRASYYYSPFLNLEEFSLIQTKSENIDTYAIRLKDIVESVKLKTGKEKINIIAFSMGGLVTRRYLQIFGRGSIDKVILIGTPNKGISGEVKTLCPLVGGKSECKDMNEDSIFLNKLNKDEFPKGDLHNIVGTGCKMGNKFGDGIILENSSKLEGATNYIVNGNCRNKLNPLHLDLINPELYPEVYNIILDILEE